MTTPCDKEAEYLAIRYFYALNCTDGGLNHSLETDYVWVSSSVYLVVEPNALKDLTCGIVDVTQGNLSINLQCLCPTYPDDVTSILRRLTAYVSQKTVYRALRGLVPISEILVWSLCEGS